MTDAALIAERDCLRRVVDGLDSPLSCEARQVLREVRVRGAVVPSSLWRAVPIPLVSRRMDAIDELMAAGLVGKRYESCGGFFHYVAEEAS